MERCIFCEPKREILAQNTHAIAVFDSFPVSPGHVLILPRRHVVTIWDLEPEEYSDCFTLVRHARSAIESRFSPDGLAVHARSPPSPDSLARPVGGGRLALGAWQGLYLYEHGQAGHARSVVVTVMGEV